MSIELDSSEIVLDLTRFSFDLKLKAAYVLSEIYLVKLSIGLLMRKVLPRDLQAA